MLTQAILLMVGMIVGAGIFAVPYVFAQSGAGFGVAIFAIVLAIVLCVHRMYTDIVVVTKGKHRLIGNAHDILGSATGRFTSLLVIAGNLASLLIYMVLGGTFLHALFGNVLQLPVAAFQIAFLLIGAACLGVGPALVAQLNSACSIALIVLFVGISAITGWQLHLPNVLYFDTTSAFLPYGVLLFSLTGINAVPEIYALMRGNASSTKQAVVRGTYIAGAVTVLFGIAVVGYTGPFTTQDAILGIARNMGSWVLVLGACLGLLAVFTSFIILALNLDETFRLDIGLSKRNAWLAATVPVLVMFALGARNLITIISFTGTLLGGATMLLISIMYLKLLKSKTTASQLEFGRLVPIGVSCMIILGMLTELW